MAITKEEVKRYLRIEAEYTDEDTDIDKLIAFSIEYIKGATGLAETDSETYRLAQKMIICDRYENRGGNSVEIKPSNALTLLLTQLKNAEVVTSATI